MSTEGAWQSWKHLTKEQSKDAGMAFTVILLLLGLSLKSELFFKVAFIGLLLNMAWPMLFKPFALVWFNLAVLLGNFSSKVLLSVVFFIMVVPVALFRKLIGKDKLLLTKFKKSGDSVFITRNHEYNSKEIQQPF